jgi:hypothetical protein
VPRLDEFDLTLCPLQGAKHTIDAITRITKYVSYAPCRETLHIWDMQSPLGTLPPKRGRKINRAPVSVFR